MPSQTLYARVKDSERKFLEASMKVRRVFWLRPLLIRCRAPCLQYIELSHNVGGGISHDDLMTTLQNAVRH